MKKMKKALSLFLALVMVLGMVNLSVFAVTTEKPAEIVTNGELVATEDELVTVQKTAKHTSGNDFEITLTVTTKDTVTTTPAQGTHVVLVIDRSGSMGEGSRIDSAQTAAKTFAEKMFAKGTSEDNRIAVVSYASDARTDTELTHNKETVDSAVGKLSANGGTNIQAGIHMAQQILDQDTATNVKKVIVVLSDGQPTYSYQRNVTAGWVGCDQKMWGHIWQDGMFGSGHATEIVYGTGFNYDLTVGNGSDYNYTLKAKVTCKHEKTEWKATNQVKNHGDSTIEEAGLAKDKGTEIYSIFLGRDDTVGPTVLKGVATDEAHYQSSPNVEDLAGIFGSIADSVTTETNAGTVVDPMGEFITLGDVSNIPGVTANADGKGFTWKLPTDVEAKDGTKTYTIKYPITLDVTADNFVENHVYATNGTTTFTYSVNGVEKTVDFDVPTVKGYLPTVGWTIEYYQQQDATAGDYANYTKVEGDTKTGTDKFGTQVVLGDKDAGYADKYDNYTCVSDNQTITLGLDPDENVIKVYYDLQLANVTVKHWVVIKTQTDDGDSYAFEQGTPVVKTYPEEGSKLYIGDTFNNSFYLTGDKLTRLTGDESVIVNGTTYTSDNDQLGTLTVDNNGKTVNLYYVREGEDQRTKVTYDVNYYYREDTWELNPYSKRFELKTGEYVKDETLSKSGMEAFLTQGTVTAPAEDKNGTYTLDAAKSTENLTITLTKDGPNVINAYYYKSPEKPAVKEARLTITHKYYMKNSDGTITLDGTVTEMDNQPVYVGETYYATCENQYNGKEYQIVLPVDIVRLIAEAGKHYEMTVEYVCEAPKADASVVVNHTYWTEVWTPIEVEPAVEEVTDPETGEVITPAQEAVYEYQYVRNTTADSTQKDEVAGLKEGDLFNLEAKPAGYEFLTDGSDVPGTKVLAADTNMFHINYVKYQGGPEDESDKSASVTVVHVYTEYKTYIGDDGNIVYDEPQLPVEQREETVTGYPDETFYAEKQENDGFEFVSSDTPDLKVTLRTAGGEYHLRYEKSTSDLGEPVTVKVQPIFKTYTTSIDGNGQTVRELTNTETAEQAELGSYYVGQTAVAIPGGYNKAEYEAVFDKDGKPVLDNNGNQLSAPVYTYTPSESENTPDAAIVVAEGENVITLVFVKEEDARVPAVVAVKNHYTTLTKSMGEDGKYNEDWTISADKVTVLPDLFYVGQVISTIGRGTDRGFILDTRDGVVQPEESITLTEQYTELNFYWYREVGDNQPTTVQVIHHYKIVDANPSVADNVWTTGDKPEDVLKGYTVGWTYVASPDYANGRFTEENITGTEPANAFDGVELVAGENVIHVYYEKHIDTRPETSVKVIHEYYASASAETPAFKDEEITNNLRAPSEFKATAKPTKNDVTYTQTTENSALTITLVENAGENVIVIKYVRANTTYQVVHEYYTDNVLSGSTNSVVAGEAGATITADGISKVLSYGGNSYSYTNASGAPLTLVQGENGTITLRYDRTTGSTWTPTGPDYYRLTINYVDEEGNVVAAQYVSGRHTSGWKYDIASPEVEGYTPRQAAVTGTLTRNTTLEVVYTKDVEIEDDNPPLAEPDTFKLTVHYVYADGSVAAEDSVKDGLLAGDSYSVTSPVLEGYTVDYELVAGTMPGEDLEFTVVYTPVETEVPEEQPPLVDVPDVQPPLVDVPDVQPPLVDVPDVQPPLVEWPDTAPVVNVPEEQPPLVEVPDEDVPMTGVPQTGDYSMVWYVAALLSALGLIVLTFKKREDEEG